VQLFTDPNVVAKIRESARLARKMLDFANSLVEPGITTDEIDKLTFLEIVKHGAYPSPVNYCGFPKAICASVNEVVCHGIPDDRLSTLACFVCLYVLFNSDLPYCIFCSLYLHCLRLPRGSLTFLVCTHRKLEKGDMVSLDVSVFYNGYHGDNCGTVICGGDACGDESAIALRDATKDALEKAISVIGPGK
jgi:methionyl aminopeptidase